MSNKTEMVFSCVDMQSVVRDLNMAPEVLVDIVWDKELILKNQWQRLHTMLEDQRWRALQDRVYLGVGRSLLAMIDRIVEEGSAGQLQTNSSGVDINWQDLRQEDSGIIEEICGKRKASDLDLESDY